MALPLAFQPHLAAKPIFGSVVRRLLNLAVGGKALDFLAQSQPQ
jgi:hypothetical protein